MVGRELAGTRVPRPSAVLLGVDPLGCQHRPDAAAVARLPALAEYLELFRRIHQALRPVRAADALVSLLVIAVLPGLCEELLMRGVLLQLAGAAAGPGAALVVSAMLFAIIHLDAFRFLFTLTIGLVLGCAAANGPLWPPALAHLTLNGITFAIAPLVDDPSKPETPDRCWARPRSRRAPPATAAVLRGLRGAETPSNGLRPGARCRLRWSPDILTPYVFTLVASPLRSSRCRRSALRTRPADTDVIRAIRRRCRPGAQRGLLSRSRGHRGVPRGHGRARHGARPARRRRAGGAALPAQRRVLVRLEPGLAVTEAVRAFSSQPEVLYAEPNGIVRRTEAATLTPDDKFYKYQWNMKQVNAERTWGIQKGKATMAVAVLDTGVAYEDYADPRTRQQFRKAPDWGDTVFLPGHDFVNGDDHPNDDEYHGTHVASTIAEATNNGLGMAGLAFGCAIMPVKVLDEFGEGTFYDVAEGIDYAVEYTQNGQHPVKVINLSLGTTGYSETIKLALDRAHAAGVLVVAASGNSGKATVEFPANQPQVVAVGALDQRKEKAPYSNTGTELGLVAPGGNCDRDDDADGTPDCVFQQMPDPDFVDLGRYDRFCYCGLEGTSMATPHVAAAAALLFSQGFSGPGRGAHGTREDGRAPGGRARRRAQRHLRLRPDPTGERPAGHRHRPRPEGSTTARNDDEPTARVRTGSPSSGRSRSRHRRSARRPPTRSPSRHTLATSGWPPPTPRTPCSTRTAAAPSAAAALSSGAAPLSAASARTFAKTASGCSWRRPTHRCRSSASRCR